MTDVRRQEQRTRNVKASMKQIPLTRGGCASIGESMFQVLLDLNRDQPIEFKNQKFSPHVSYSVGKAKRWKMLKEWEASASKQREDDTSYYVCRIYGTNDKAPIVTSQRCHTFVTSENSASKQNKNRKSTFSNQTHLIKKLMNMPDIVGQEKDNTVKVFVVDPPKRNSKLFYSKMPIVARCVGEKPDLKKSVNTKKNRKMRLDMACDVENWEEEPDWDRQDCLDLSQCEMEFFQDHSCNDGSWMHEIDSTRISISSALTECRQKMSKKSKRSRRTVGQVNKDKSRVLIYMGEQKNVSAPAPISLLNIQKESPQDPPVPQLISTIASEQCQPECLVRTFGSNYYEARMFPRRFLLDVSEHGKNNFRFVTFEHLSPSPEDYLIRVHVSADLNVDLFNRTFEHTTYIDSLPQWLLQLNNFLAVTVPHTLSSDTPKMTHGFEFSIKHDSLLPYYSKSGQLSLESFFKAHPEWQSSPAAAKATPAATSQSTIAQLVQNFHSDSMECEICLDTLLPDQKGTLCHLQQCGHTFCRSCLRTYVCDRLVRGNTQLLCPSYPCKTQLHCATVLCLEPPFPLYQQHLEDLCKMVTGKGSIHQTNNFCRCPNPTCRRFIQLAQAKTGATGGCASSVLCPCGTRFCADCQKEAHWPLSCTVRAKHLDRQRQLGDLEQFDWILKRSMVVKGRTCPICDRFIEKNGGCNHISCICGAYFCWVCGKFYEAYISCHHTTSASKSVEEFEFTGPVASGLRSKLYCLSLSSRLTAVTYKRRVFGKHKEISLLLSAGDITIMQIINTVNQIFEIQENILLWADFIQSRGNAAREKRKLMIQSLKFMALQLNFVLKAVENLTEALRSTQVVCQRRKTALEIARWIHIGKQMISRFQKFALPQ